MSQWKRTESSLWLGKEISNRKQIFQIRIEKGKKGNAVLEGEEFSILTFLTSVDYGAISCGVSKNNPNDFWIALRVMTPAELQPPRIYFNVAVKR